MDNEQKKKFKFDYSYVIIALCFMIIAVSLGFCSSGRSTYLKAITDATKLGRGAFSLNDTFRFVTTTIINLFFGVLVAKFGTKKLICGGFVCLIAFALINSYTKTLGGFYFAAILLGVGLTFTSTTMASVVINRWCTKNKGTITGAVLSANGLGGAIAIQIVTPIIFEEGNPFGYQNSYRLVALILAVVLILLLIFFKDAPKGEGKTTVVTKKKKARGTGWVGMEPEVAVKKPYFYASLICIALTGMALHGVGGLSAPHMYDLGFDPAFVATLSSISSIVLLISKFSIGYFYDRRGLSLVMNVCFICELLSLGGLMILDLSPLGHAIALARSFLGSIAIPLETVMLPLYASEFFGNKAFDKTIGIFVSANYAGYALGSPLANFWFDKFGNYDVPIVLFIVFLIFAAVAMNLVIVAARRDKRAILAAIEPTEE